MRLVPLVILFLSFGAFAIGEEAEQMRESWKKLPMEKKIRLHKALMRVVADSAKAYPQGAEIHYQNILTVLKETKQVSVKNIRATAFALSRASRSLIDKWDIKLARESLRVMSLVMKTRKNYQFNADLFVEVLNSDKKDKFLKEAQNILSKKDYKIFSENVDLVLNSSGNG